MKKIVHLPQAYNGMDKHLAENDIAPPKPAAQPVSEQEQQRYIDKIPSPIWNIVV